MRNFIIKNNIKKNLFVLGDFNDVPEKVLDAFESIKTETGEEFLKLEDASEGMTYSTFKGREEIKGEKFEMSTKLRKIDYVFHSAGDFQLTSIKTKKNCNVQNSFLEIS